MLTPPNVVLAELSGLLGVVLYVFSYGLLQCGRLSQNGIGYSVLNFLAASLVLVSLSVEFNLASALIQASWIIISIFGLLRLAKMRRQQRNEQGRKRRADTSTPVGKNAMLPRGINDPASVTIVHCPDRPELARKPRAAEQGFAEDLTTTTYSFNKRTKHPDPVTRSYRDRQARQPRSGLIELEDAKNWMVPDLDLGCLPVSQPTDPEFAEHAEQTGQADQAEHAGHAEQAEQADQLESPLQSIKARLNRAVERLPPFWTAFALTLTETVGAGTLALPIAIASVGPLAGVALLVFLGLLNLITITFLAEASARNNALRHGNAFIGRLVSDFLGSSATLIMRLALFSFCCIVLVSYFTGFASTLSAATGVTELVWVTVICGGGLLLIVSKGLTGTVVTSLLIGAINIVLLIILSIMALQHASMENLLSAGFSLDANDEFELSKLQLVFGVILVSYFGHLSVSNCAKTVLHRDPDGRSLKRGTAAAILVAIVIYCFWSLSIGAAISSERLLNEAGTALVPLAEQLGPQVLVPGTLFAVLALGMSSVHYGLGIVNLCREFLCPSERQPEPSGCLGHVRTVLPFVPLFAIYGYVQWTFVTGTSSFTAPLNLLGAIVAPVLAGIFPILLLLTSRAKGLPNTDARVSGITSSPFVLAFIMILSFYGIVSHAIVNWQDPVSRIAPMLVALIMAALIIELCVRQVFSSSSAIQQRSTYPSFV